MTESLSSPAAVRKAEREIAGFRKYEELSREFVNINAQICHVRPVEEPAQSLQEKKRLKPSKRKSPAK